MITVKKLKELGFEQECVHSTTYVQELNPNSVNGTFVGDSIVIEADIEDGVVNFHYVGKPVVKDEVLYVFFNKVNTDAKLEQLLNLIN